MNSNAKVVAEFTDRYGDKKKVHNTRHGLTIKRERSTVCLSLCKIVGQLVGLKIMAERQKAGLTLEGLCLKAGMTGGKSRMYEIERGSRGDGIRLGTLYAVALALNIDPTNLLPSADEVKKAAKVKFADAKLLTLVN